MWLTVDEIVELGRGRRKTLLKIASGEWQSRLSERRGQNGKRIKEVLLTSLPSDLQQAYLQRTQPAQVELPECGLQGGAIPIQVLLSSMRRSCDCRWQSARHGSLKCNDSQRSSHATKRSIRDNNETSHLASQSLCLRCSRCVKLRAAPMN